jgi:hypothetical protein
MPEYVYPEEIDRHLNWPLGTATRLARATACRTTAYPTTPSAFAWRR